MNRQEEAAVRDAGVAWCSEELFTKIWWIIDAQREIIAKKDEALKFYAEMFDYRDLARAALALKLDREAKP